MQQEEEDFDKSSVSYISDKRTAQYQQQSKMYNIDETIYLPDDNSNSTTSHTNNVNSEGGEEMILTAAKLTPHIMPSSSAINNKTSSPITTASLC
jgi:hypothetical protein